MDGRSLRFPRAERLRSRRDFQRLARAGRRERSSGFVLVRGAFGPGVPTGVSRRIGLTVSRKVGNAVVRNQIKRRIREWFRRRGRDRLGIGDFIVIARPGAGVLSYLEMERELDHLAARVSRSS